MRYITSEMLNKANRRIQSEATGSNPRMKVLTSRGLVKEMFRVFDVEDTAVGASTNSDVTIQRSSFGRPSQIFLTHLKNGQIEVKTKKLPYYEDIPWSLAFTISDPAGIKDSAIEFDGYWQRKQGEKRFDFISDELPYIFYVNGLGELYCQRWSKGADKVQLATGVGAISVVRGWVPVQAGHYDDQGLIVAYVKSDGLVYYRNYCINLAGSKSWEVERLVPGLPAGVVRVSSFRTNDFRVGFLAETSAGGIHMAVTDRNWAGMSFEAENINANLDARIVLNPVTYSDISNDEERLSATIDAHLQLCPGIYDNLWILDAVDIDSYTIKLTLNYDLLEVSASAFSIVGYNVTSVLSTVNSKEIILGVDRELKGVTDIIYSAGKITFKVCDACIVIAENSMSASISRVTYSDFYNNEHLTASIDSLLVLSDVDYSYVDAMKENLSASVDAKIALLDIDENPV